MRAVSFRRRSLIRRVPSSHVGLGNGNGDWRVSPTRASSLFHFIVQSLAICLITLDFFINKVAEQVTQYPLAKADYKSLSVKDADKDRDL
jgi:hypothetical protein